ncbi:uncharacterized protein LOC125512349 isoform X2 [Triticum urartu]|uniref:uncharacterized protein LOC125512349 isoform X2 n=1 Tax=Triticum urartu TaxID=4572 RepID=UPI002043FFBF|nr:uncharacterized protein LOC125512349 isoform X2 [Triticum urartu]
MLTYPSDHRGYPPQHVAVSPFSTAAAPFTVDGLHPADQTFPSPSLDAPGVTSLYATGEWGNASWMEAPVRYMAPDAAASASPGYTGHYHLNKDLSGPATSPIDVAPSFPVKSLTSEITVGNISCRAAEAEKNANTQILTKEGQEHSHCHPDAEENLLQMSDSSSRNQATFLKLIHNLSVVLLSTCNGGSSLQEYEEKILKSVIRNLKAASSKGGKATLKSDDCLRDSVQISCLRNNLLVAMPEHSVSDSEFKTSISQALSKLPEGNMLDDTEVSQVSIYKKLWFEAEASVCKLKYELQRSRMKLATMEVFSNTQTVPIDPSESEKASRVTVSDGQPRNHAKYCSSCAATLQCHGGAAQVPAASPVPPPPALVSQPYTAAPDNPSEPYCGYCHKLGLTPHPCYKKNDQGDNIFSGASSLPGPCQSSSTGQELLTQPPPPPPSDISSPGSIIATNKSIVNGLDAEIFAQMKVLESRIDNISSLGESKCERQQEPSKGSYPVEDDVLARLRILKSRPDYITSLGLESSNHQLDTSIHASDEVHEMFARLKVLESRIDKISPLGDNKCEQQEKGSEGLYPVEDAVLARLQILKSCADNTSLGLESNKQQLNASTDISDEVEDVIMARLEILKSHPDVEASSIEAVEGVEHPCAVGLRVSSHQLLPSPAAVFEKTTLLSATEPLEVTGETPAILISSSNKAPPLCRLKDAPSVMEKDHSGLAEEALHSAPLLSVPQEAGGLAQKTAKAKRHPHGPTPRRFRLPSTVKIKCPISE